MAGGFFVVLFPGVPHWPPTCSSPLCHQDKTPRRLARGSLRAAPRCPRHLKPFALDQPQAQPLKVARREFIEGQGVGCAGESPLWDGIGPGSGAPFCVQGISVVEAGKGSL